MACVVRFCLKDEREIKGEREEEMRQKGGERRRGEGEGRRNWRDVWKEKLEEGKRREGTLV